MSQLLKDDTELPNFMKLYEVPLQIISNIFLITEQQFC